MAKRQHSGPSGLIVIDKPAGITSHDVVSRLRRLAGTSKVGHAGTLDPMATGVLICGVGKATKLLTFVVGQTKTYTATVRLGQSTLTDDAAGEVIEQASATVLARVSRERIDTEVARLTGDIMQVPSAVSAIKVDGVRSYARVRNGEEVELAARPVTISELTVHSVNEHPQNKAIDVGVTVSCSSGTYIRALARDLGAALGVGGHLIALRRTRIGEITIEAAHPLESLTQLSKQGQPLPMMSLENTAAKLFPVRHLTAVQATDVSNGRRIAASSAEKGGGTLAALAPDGSLVALVENKTYRGELVAAPTLVFEAGTTYRENT